MRNQLFHANLFPDLSKVTLRRVFKTDRGWVMEADGQDSAVCPGCQSISRSHHSRYWRSLKDLPVQDTPVILRLHVGRWRYRNAGCQRQIFIQHLSEVSRRLQKINRHIYDVRQHIEQLTPRPVFQCDLYGLRRILVLSTFILIACKDDLLPDTDCCITILSKKQSNFPA